MYAFFLLLLSALFGATSVRNSYIHPIASPTDDEVAKNGRADLEDELASQRLAPAPKLKCSNPLRCNYNVFERFSTTMWAFRKSLSPV